MFLNVNAVRRAGAGLEEDLDALLPPGGEQGNLNRENNNPNDNVINLWPGGRGGPAAMLNADNHNLQMNANPNNNANPPRQQQQLQQNQAAADVMAQPRDPPSPIVRRTTRGENTGEPTGQAVWEILNQLYDEERRKVEGKAHRRFHKYCVNAWEFAVRKSISVKMASSSLLSSNQKSRARAASLSGRTSSMISSTSTLSSSTTVVLTGAGTGAAPTPLVEPPHDQMNNNAARPGANNSTANPRGVDATASVTSVTAEPAPVSMMWNVQRLDVGVKENIVSFMQTEAEQPPFFNARMAGDLTADLRRPHQTQQLKMILDKIRESARTGHQHVELKPDFWAREACRGTGWCYPFPVTELETLGFAVEEQKQEPAGGAKGVQQQRHDWKTRTWKCSWTPAPVNVLQAGAGGPVIGHQVDQNAARRQL
ncbi:unnamed protein product [Amoebophrya sp. A120]|nr:unnamed protein product [Amoebophrya sp. A120]|eukprot:GSA120T00012646001.1